MNVQTQVKIAREGGAVERCHATPHVGTYNNAQHSYGAISLLLILHSNPSRDLVKAVAFHDCAERWLGDVPATGKHGALRDEYEEAEAKLLLEADLVPVLSEDDYNWLKAVDILDLWLWAREQLALGNTLADEIRERCEIMLDRRCVDQTLPQNCALFFQQTRFNPHRRLSSVWQEVLDGLGQTRG